MYEERFEIKRKTTTANNPKIKTVLCCLAVLFLNRIKSLTAMIRKVVWACLASLSYHDQMFSLHCQIARVHSVSGLILKICYAFNRAMALMLELKLVREEKHWLFLLVPHFQL